MTKLEAQTVPTERGATAVEYAIMLSGIAAVVIGVIYLLGGAVVTLFNTAVAAF